MPALADWSCVDRSMGSYSDTRPVNHTRSNFFNGTNKITTNGSANGTSLLRGGLNRNDDIPPPKRLLFDGARLRMKWCQKRMVGVGLINVGNTCFINSVLQCLSYTAPLFHHLTEEGHKSTCRESGFCILCLLQDHVIKSILRSGEPFKPLQIIQNLRNIAKCLTWGRQEDAHEFLRYVVDAMQKSCLSGTTGLDKHSKETTLVHQVFGGYLRSQVMCLRCKHASNTFDPFLDISVDIKDVSTLRLALSKFVTPETLDIENAYKCESCMTKVRAHKRFTIHRNSNVLTIHLKRFDMNRMLGTKVTRHIKFPPELDIRPYMSTSTGTPVHYSLYGVLVHSGFTCNSGHYYSYIKAPDDTWYCMNDSTVTKTSLNSVLDAEAYILFYVKREQKTVYINGKAPSTITKYEAVNGSGDHAVNRRVIIGPQLPGMRANGDSAGTSCLSKPTTSSSTSTSSTRISIHSLVPYTDDRDSPEKLDDSAKTAAISTTSGNTATNTSVKSVRSPVTLHEYKMRQAGQCNGANHTNGQTASTVPSFKFTPRCINKPVANGISAKTTVSVPLVTDIPKTITSGKPSPKTICTDSAQGKEENNHSVGTTNTNGLDIQSKKPLNTKVCHEPTQDVTIGTVHSNTEVKGSEIVSQQSSPTANSKSSVSHNNSPTTDHKVLLSSTHDRSSEHSREASHNAPRNGSVGRLFKSSAGSSHRNYRDGHHSSVSRRRSRSSSTRRRRRSRDSYRDRSRSRSPLRRSRSPRHRTRSPYRHRRNSRSPSQDRYGRSRYKRTYARRERHHNSPYRRGDDHRYNSYHNTQHRGSEDSRTRKRHNSPYTGRESDRNSTTSSHKDKYRTVDNFSPGSHTNANYHWVEKTKSSLSTSNKPSASSSLDARSRIHREEYSHRQYND